MFQFFQVDHGDSQLGGAVPCSSIAATGGSNDRLCTFPAEAVPEDGQFIEGFRLDIADFAAYKQGYDTSRCYHIDLIGYAPMP